MEAQGEIMEVEEEGVLGWSNN